MPYTGDAEHTMLAALSPVFVGAFTKEAAITTWTGAGTILTHTAHGLVDKDLVIVNSFTGGTVLKAGRAYYVKKVGVNEIELFTTYALANADSVASVTEASISKLVELSGGSPAYARVACTFAAAASRARKDATEHELNVKAGGVVDYVGFFSAESGAGNTLAVAEVTKETFAGQGVYKTKEGALDLLAAA